MATPFLPYVKNNVFFFSGGELCAACLKAGLLTVPAGVNVLRLVPPLIVSEAEAAQALTMLKEALVACVAEKA